MSTSKQKIVTNILLRNVEVKALKAALEELKAVASGEHNLGGG